MMIFLGAVIFCANIWKPKNYYVLCDKDSGLIAFPSTTKLMNVSGLIVNFHALGAVGAYWVESTLLTKEELHKKCKTFDVGTLLERPYNCQILAEWKSVINFSWSLSVQFVLYDPYLTAD